MTPVELDAVRARAAMVAAWLEIERLSEPTGSAMVLARTDVPNLLALVAELTRERDEALQGYRDGQSIKSCRMFASVAEVRAYIEPIRRAKGYVELLTPRAVSDGE